MKNNLSSVCARAGLAVLMAVLPATFAAASTGGDSEKSMTSAHESFLKGDMQKASASIGKAADSVKRESGKVTASAKAGVIKAGDDLAAFGKKVKTGAVKSDEEVKKQFARADNAVAKAWHATAAESMKAGQDAGAALKKAGESVSDAAKWSGTQLKKGTQASVNAVKTVGSGVKAGGKEMAGWFRGIGDGIKDVAGKL